MPLASLMATYKPLRGSGRCLKGFFCDVCMCVCADIVQTGPPETAMLQYVMHLLAVEDIEGLPPGGGINAK